MNKNKFVRVLIPNKDGKLLIMREDRTPPRWNFPGGKLDDGEGFEAAAKREVFEELNLEINDLEPFLTLDSNLDGDIWFGSFFVANDVKGDLVIREPDQCFEVKYAGIDEILKLPGIKHLFHDPAKKFFSDRAKKTSTLWAAQFLLEEITKRFPPPEGQNHTFFFSPDYDGLYLSICVNNGFLPIFLDDLDLFKNPKEIVEEIEKLVKSNYEY